MTTVASLKTKRGQIKASLTRFETFLSKQHNEGYNTTQIQSRLDVILPLLSEFNSIQDEIIEQSQDVGLDNELLELESFENSYFDITCTAKDIISKNNKPVFSPTIIGSEKPNVKLPDLELPKFNGAYSDWLKFEDTFKSLIHNNSSLSEVQKFYYLNSCLSGEAESLIQALEITSANYEIAWNLLRERFHNKKLIIKNHVTALFNLDNVSKESHTNLRNLVGTFKRHLHCLASLNEPVDHWDTLLIYLVSSKLDTYTQREWEKYSIKNDLVKMNDLINFINEKCSVLETLSNKPNDKLNCKFDKPKLTSFKQNSKSFISNNNMIVCLYCKGEHSTYNCSDLLKLDVKARYTEIKLLKVCINCLKRGHSTNSCSSSGCKLCNKKHNTILHFDNKPKSNPQISRLSDSNINAPSTSTDPNIASLTSLNGFSMTNVLLSTALIQVFDRQGSSFHCRAILDNGSQSSYITENLCKKLGISEEDISMSIHGVGGENSGSLHLSKFANIKIRSRSSNYTKNIDCLLIPKITSAMPKMSFSPNLLQIPKNLFLADPMYYESAEVDMLIGAGIFWELLCIGQIALGPKLPILQKTKFGWVVSGNMPQPAQHKSFCHFSLNLDQQLSKFWEIEEVISDKKLLSQEEQFCETLYTNTTTRDSDGRFIVRLPFKSGINNLGDSKQNALKRFYALERKLDKNASLKENYSTFISEYQTLNHMHKIDDSKSHEHETKGFYLPHHAIIKESSLTTKLRVVFDGSAHTTNGKSLNDYQMVGPVLQDDLFSILIRFRKHSIVLAADISKMYRQVQVHKDDTIYQKILWRYSSSTPVESYCLNTVTYGTAAASFLAIRCLQQVAHDFKESLPEASSVILSDFYVDDLLTGTDSIENATILQRDITNILASGCFELRKWICNNPAVLKNIPNNSEPFVLSFSESKEFKTLGLQWDTVSDNLQYSVNLKNQTDRITKRHIISTIAQIFDPLGLLGPYIITAKIMIQRLWQLKLDWDESLPSSMHNLWLQFKDSLQHLNIIKIERFTFCQKSTRIEMHGFSDASESAYGACIYIKTINSNAETICKLLCAKTRVAPLKNVTLPRLELCGALLLARLVKKTITALKVNFDNVYYWCDSTIALSWLSAPSNRWKTFVANRVAEIQDLTNIESWHYVNTHENPADLLTRGISIQNLSTLSLWWHGPSWLSNSELLIRNMCENSFTVSELPEMRPDTHCLVVTTASPDIFDKFGSFTKLQRVIAYCKRFITNCKLTKDCRTTGNLTVNELINSSYELVRIAQSQSFSSEIHSLRESRLLDKKSKILSLNPFLDSLGLLRVGGRIQNSSFNYDKCHPMILPHKHKLTDLIINYYHIKLLHAGTQLTLSNLREIYWPINAKCTVKRIIHECVRCFRCNAQSISPLMGNLPKTRVTPSRPFQNTGVDYAGPIMIKDKKSRGFKIIKGYICIFICFATKAIHIELVSDLTTECFIAALRRFTSRRGMCTNLYSDNGKNFVGANTELKTLYEFLLNNLNVIHSELADQTINWHFIPPRTPHFGGIWEAGVKSIKHHLRRVVGNAHLTFEELYTVLTQIEACLNSRPLTPISDDPNDFKPLTPSHFLIGESLKGLPNPNVLHLSDNTLSRFQRCQKLQQHFWNRWSKEYVATLQQRTKWKQQSLPVTTGMMVLLQEDNMPSLNWKLGRITDIHPGTDGIVRAVTVKTANGVVKRGVKKIAILPINQ